MGTFLSNLRQITHTKRLRSIKITVTDADYHPSWSSRMAFRMAGREAGRKLVKNEFDEISF
jgi:hypothetical protein